MILDNKNKIKKIVLGMASSISIAIALIVPAEHYYTGYGYLRKLNEDKAVYTATELSNFVFMNPDSWDIQEHRYTAIIESHRIEGGNNVALYDINGDYIFSTETKLDEPVVGMKREIFNGNEVVGYLYSEYSLNEILWEVLYSIIVGIMLAVIVFVVLYKIPIKALSLALNELDEALAALVSEVEQKEGALKKAKNLSDALYDMAMHDSLTGL
ncbi:MAG: hypothetical protein OEY89_17000, partial [Gammaproteobacteria bacterium]|nr:hypothetical protein [Gammaproteobacteria bacterium]